MKKSIVMFIMLILDLVIYFSIVDIKFQQSNFNYLKVLFLVLIIPLLYVIINDVIKVAKLKFDELIDLKKLEKSNIDLRIETLISENEKIRLENNKLMENIQSNNEKLCKYIVNVQEQLIEGMDKLKINISNSVENLSINVKNATNTVRQGNDSVIENVSALINMEKKFVENINVSIDVLNNRYEKIDELFTLKNNELRESLFNQYNELKITLGNNYKELSDTLVEKYNEVANLNSKGIEKLTKSEENNKKVIEENLGELASLIEDTIRELKNNLTEAIEDNNEGLSRVISRNLSKLDKNNKDLNNKLQELSERTHLENKAIILDIGNSISKVANLHNDMLIKMDENQTKLLELNKEDINLMKELIR